MDMLKNFYLLLSFLIGFFIVLFFFKFLVMKNINLKNKLNSSKKNIKQVEIKNTNNSLRTLNSGSINYQKNVDKDNKEKKDKKEKKENEERFEKNEDLRKNLNQLINLLGEELTQKVISMIADFLLNPKIEIFVDTNLFTNSVIKEDKRKTIFKNELLLGIMEVRKNIFSMWGVIIPGVKVKDDINLNNNTYVIKIKNIEVAKGRVGGSFFALGYKDVICKLSGEKCIDPLYGLSGVWIEESQLGYARELGCFVQDYVSFICKHLQKVIEDRISEIFDAVSYYMLLEIFEANNFKHDFLRNSVSYKVLKNLLSEGISIRQMRDIMSAIIVGSNYTKDPDKLTEYVRINIPHVISESFSAPDKIIYAAKLDTEIEELILRKLENLEKDYVKICNNYDITSTVFSQIRDESDYYISYLQTLYEIANSKIILGIESSIREYLDYCLSKNLKPVIITSLNVRRAFKEILKIHFKNVNIFVISNFEIHPDYQVKFVSNISNLI